MNLKLEYILGGLGLACLLLALIFSTSTGNKQSLTLPGNGGVFGPITVKENNTAYTITVQNHVPLNSWSNINIDVLDHQKQLLFAFSDGMWHERGRDSDGTWIESKSKFTIDTTFKEAGQYYLSVTAERNDDTGRNITISAVQKRGSHLPFLILGAIALYVQSFYFISIKQQTQ